MLSAARARIEIGAGASHLADESVSEIMLSPRRFWSLLKESVSAWISDYAPSMGAAIAYYTAFSIAPLLLLVIAVAGFVFGRDAVQGEIVGQAQGLMGEEGAVAIEGLLESASEPTSGLIASAISIMLLIFGATTVFAEIQNALDRIWHVPEQRKPGGVWGFLRTRVLSFGLILGLAFLMLVSLVVSTAVAALGSWWAGYFEGAETLLQIINLLVSLLFSASLFAMIYKLMPRTEIAWADVWVGALVTSILFEVGKIGIGLYLGKSGVTSGFGAAGSFAVLLIWVYYSAQIFLLGAEFTRAYARARGSSGASRTTAPDAAKPRTQGTA
jgi:membrane protein